MKKIWNDEELGQHWSLTYEELELLKTKPEKNHLAFCMQLKYYQYYGAFPENEKELSEITVQYISEQLEIDIDTLFYYDWENRTARRHKQEILIFLKIRKIDSKDRINIINWLIGVSSRKVKKTGLRIKSINNCYFDSYYELFNLNGLSSPSFNVTLLFQT
ncbi:DUF4158 domain-containing protein [Elizabethkingia ursingii]